MNPNPFGLMILKWTIWKCIIDIKQDCLYVLRLYLYNEDVTVQSSSVSEKHLTTIPDCWLHYRQRTWLLKCAARQWGGKCACAINLTTDRYTEWQQTCCQSFFKAKTWKCCHSKNVSSTGSEIAALDINAWAPSAVCVCAPDFINLLCQWVSVHI